jgi:hypothetical protein
MMMSLVGSLSPGRFCLFVLTAIYLGFLWVGSMEVAAAGAQRLIYLPDLQDVLDFQQMQAHTTRERAQNERFAKHREENRWKGAGA